MTRLLWAYLGLLLLLPCLWAWLGERHWLLVLLRYLPAVCYLVPLLLILLVRRPLPPALVLLTLLVYLGLYSGLALNWPRSGQLKVLTWNIHAGVDGLKQVQETLLSQAADIVLLQEARRPARGGEDPLPRLTEGYHFARGGSAGELAILSRSPILRSGELPSAGWRPGLFADLDLGQARLRVINVHYLTGAPGQHLGSSRQGRRAYLVSTAEVRRQQTMALEKALEGWTGGVLIGGDFNSPPGSFTHRRLSSRWHDSHARAGLGFGLTYPARTPLWRIDFLFSSMTPLSSLSLETQGSDHRIVVAEY
ncbi:MAG: hypothetical protein AMXMBFR33_54540 [Candidatus Xenobia bacterium]